MKYALVNGEKTEATKGVIGGCPSCGVEMVAKCGDLKVHHWSHKGIRNCDHWWENETEWHRSWKGHFAKERQEVIHFDETGEKHIADVKTNNGWVLEFQHSFLQNIERQARNTFYKKMVWVVNGTRRKNDKNQFFKLLKECTQLRTNVPIIRLNFLDECRLIKEWHGDSLVFFDFKSAEDAEEKELWFLFPKTHSSSAYLSPFSRTVFIELFQSDNFDNFINTTILPIYNEIADGEKRQRQVGMHDAISLPGYDKHLRNIQRRRRRF